MRANSFDLVVTDVELLEAREILAEVTVKLCYTIALQIKHKQGLKSVTLEAQGFRHVGEPTILQDELMIDGDLFSHLSDLL